MLYRTMPKNGDQLSILGFGCMRLPMDESGAINQHRTVRQIHHAVDQGVNYLDTAWSYHGGHSEGLLGRAIRDGYREKVEIATKLPSWPIGTREDMDDYLNRQLERLDTAGSTITSSMLSKATPGASWRASAFAIFSTGPWPTVAS